MKFTIDTEAMLKGLTNLAKVIPAHPVLPVLSNFLFTLRGEELTLAAMDGDRDRRERTALHLGDRPVHAPCFPGW